MRVALILGEDPAELVDVVEHAVGPGLAVDQAGVVEQEVERELLGEGVLELGLGPAGSLTLAVGGLDLVLERVGLGVDQRLEAGLGLERSAALGVLGRVEGEDQDLFELAGRDHRRSALPLVAQGLKNLLDALGDDRRPQVGLGARPRTGRACWPPARWRAHRHTDVQFLDLDRHGRPIPSTCVHTTVKYR